MKAYIPSKVLRDYRLEKRLAKEVRGVRGKLKRVFRFELRDCCLGMVEGTARCRFALDTFEGRVGRVPIDLDGVTVSPRGT